MLRPLVVGSQAVPVPVIAPLIIFLLGFGLAPKVAAGRARLLLPRTINLYDGLRDVDPDARKLLRSFDASKLAVAALPRGAGGTAGGVHRARVAAAVAVIGAVFGEFAGSDSGLGHSLLTAGSSLETRARVRRRRCCCSCWRSRSTGSSRCSSAAS